jgi:hypothetical protein
MGCGQLGGCVFMTNHELKVTDIVPPKIIKPGDLSDGWSKPEWSSHSAQIAIGFSTNLNLWDFAQSEEYNVTIHVTACADQKLNPTQELQSSVYVYTKSGAFDSLGSKPPPDIGRYRVYFSVVPFPIRSDTPQTFRYDLAADPFDVCFRLRGGNMLGGTFYSNTVVIPGTTIRKALVETGQ